MHLCSPQRHVSARVGISPKQGQGDLGAAGTCQTRDAEDLAGGEVETHAAERGG